MKVTPIFSDPTSALRFLKEHRRALLTTDTDAARVMNNRDVVLSRFGPLFREKAHQLTEDDMASFLDFEDNCHWTGLHRQKTAICSEMPAVRRAISLLARRKDFDDDLEARFNQADKSVHGFGEGIITPILFVAHPEHYGVWNSKSEFALRLLSLWPYVERGDSPGRVYYKVNNALLQARAWLNGHLDAGESPVDLWTIDYYWHAIKVMTDKDPLNRLK